jgi:hypothetical protein
LVLKKQHIFLWKHLSTLRIEKKAPKVLLLPYGFVVGWFTKEDKFQLADCDFS